MGALMVVGPFLEALGVALAAVAAMGGIAIMIGQYRKGTRDETASALAVAQSEVAVYRDRMDRLENDIKEMVKKHEHDLAELHQELGKLRQENVTLRSVLTSDRASVEQVVATALAQVTRETAAAVAKVMEETAAALAIKTKTQFDAIMEAIAKMSHVDDAV